MLKRCTRKNQDQTKADNLMDKKKSLLEFSLFVSKTLQITLAKFWESFV